MEHLEVGIARGIDVSAPWAYTSFMNPFVANLVQERKELERQLREDPRQKKIEKINALLAEYKDIANGESKPQSTAAISAAQLNVVPKESKEKVVKAAIIAFLHEKGPQHRTVILDELKRRGLMGHETDPLASLAIYLSRWKDELASGGGNGIWHLKT